MADWAGILAEHGPHVWRTVFRVLAHYADAHDCYQETFLAAWQLHRREPIDDWRRILTCIATRKAIDRLRMRVRAVARLEPLDAAHEPAAEADPAQPLQVAELLDRVRVGLAELPEKQAEVVWLSCVEGLSHPEIAAHLDISTGEARVLLHRGRKRLCEHLTPEPTDTRELS